MFFSVNLYRYIVCYRRTWWHQTFEERRGVWSSTKYLEVFSQTYVHTQVILLDFFLQQLYSKKSQKEMCFLGAIFACGTDTCTVFALISAHKPFSWGIYPSTWSAVGFYSWSTATFAYSKMYFQNIFMLYISYFHTTQFLYIRWT